MVAADWLQLMLPCRRQVEIDIQLDGLPEKVHSGVSGENSAATAKWRLTCSHGADAAPEWPALLAATTTATLMLRADPSYPTVALFHVSLTLRESLKRAAESPTSRSACLLSHTGSGRLLGGLQGGAHINAQPRARNRTDTVTQHGVPGKAISCARR